ncbi:hypothetical protein RHMOL_Rhmol08G0166800 [Rhododendron molle]|uniref:Uncharacterized protein n=1 Tax=Rhododendron molle TaxID=49168 RepID=A0ACC0MR54_RHOML|nr:hypothetical protein RHMOL_Rhmol08G0166800 [Rhododendron molle]
MPETQPKPIIEVPTEEAICVIQTLDWEFKLRWQSAIETFQDIENRALIDGVWTAVGPEGIQELENGAWRDEWEERQADPFNGYSLYALFLELELADEEEDDWEWEAEPAMAPYTHNTFRFHNQSLDTVTEGLDDYSEFLNRSVEPNIHYPQCYIVNESDKPHIAVISSEELRGKTDLVTVWVDGEELIVNKAKHSPKTISNLTRSNRFYQPSNL